MTALQTRQDLARMEAIASFATSVGQVRADLSVSASQKAATIAELGQGTLNSLKQRGELTPAVNDAIVNLVKAQLSQLSQLTKEAGDKYVGLARSYQPTAKNKSRLGTWCKDKLLPIVWNDDF